MRYTAQDFTFALSIQGALAECAHCLRHAFVNLPDDGARSVGGEAWAKMHAWQAVEHLDGCALSVAAQRAKDARS